MTDQEKTKAKRKKRISLFTGLIVGGAVGSVISLFFAPDKGRNTRKWAWKKGKAAVSEGTSVAENFLKKYHKEIHDKIEKR